MGTSKDSEITRAKILQSAGNLFAQYGFKEVTVRTIVKDAKTHLSAMNYHFRSKEALYEDTMNLACDSTSITQAEKKQLMEMKPEKALYVLVSESLKEYASQSNDSWEMALINRECRSPGNVFDKVIRKYLQHETGIIANIIGKVVKKEPDSNQVKLAVIVMLALVEMFGLYKHLIDAIAPDLLELIGKKDWLSEQIIHIVVETATRKDV